MIPLRRIERAIYTLRNHSVLLSPDLAEFYGVEPRVLNQSVSRNIERFPPDFMFQLSRTEWRILKSQIVISSWGGARRAPPYAFTEQGVAMLSSVLNSPRAIRLNIEIMRAFVQFRQNLVVNAEVSRRLDEIESRVGGHDEQFIVVIRAIRELMNPPVRKRRSQIGFR